MIKTRINWTVHNFKGVTGLNQTFEHEGEEAVDMIDRTIASNGRIYVGRLSKLNITINHLVLDSAPQNTRVEMQ